MLFHRVDDLVSFGYMDSNFKAGKEEKKPTPRYLFTLSRGAISQRSIKYSCIVDSTMEVEYVAVSKASKEEAQNHMFLMELGMVPNMYKPLVIICDNNGVIS